MTSALAEQNDAMAEQSRTSDIERLSEALNNIQKSLECTICLELMTESTKTRCGHSFCKSCIGEVLQKKNACCPLCKKSLNRRNVSKDDHQQACIDKFQKLLIAIQIDTHLDILSYSKQPRNTKESCSFSDADQSNRDSNQRKSSKESIRQPKQSSNRQTGKSSVSRRTVTDYDNPRYALKVEVPSKKSSIGTTSFSPLNDHSFRPADENENAICNSPNTKIRTWLHSFPDKPSTNALTIENDNIEETEPIKRKATPIDQISNDDNKSDGTGELYRNKVDESRRTSQSRKQEDTYQITETKQFDKVIEIDSDVSGLKYKACHARIRAKNCKKNAPKPSIEETSNEQGSSTITDDQAHQIAAVDASDTTAITEHSSANWSRVIEFGKEMKRARKRKVKKLRVSTEKNTSQPRIIEDVTLTPSSKYDQFKVVSSHDTRKYISNLSEDSTLDRSGQKYTTDSRLASPNLSKIKALNETNIHDRTESFSKKKFDISVASSSNAMETSYITLEEGKQIRITNLDNDQVNQIIGLENREENFQCDEENAKNAMKYGDSPSLSPRKRLTILTPERLNESIHECEIIRDITQIPISDVANPSGLPAENQTPGPRKNNDAQRILEGNVSSQLRSPTPNKARLSLRRKLGIDDNKKVDSPPLSQLPLSDRTSVDIHERNLDDRKSVCSPVPTNDSLLNRLTAVRCNLSLKMTNENQLQIDRNTVSADTSLKRTIEVENNGENVSKIVRQDKELVCNIVVSKKLKNIKDQGCSSPVKFMQLGTLNRFKRHKVKYLYEGATKREQVIPVEFRVASVHNMQELMNGSEMEQHITNTLRSLATSNPSNDMQNSIDITMIENIRFVDSLNANRAISEDAGSCAISSISRISATSTPKKDADCHLNRKKSERSSAIENQQSCIKSNENVEESAHSPHKMLSANSSSSRIHSSNSVKLLSPNKDSQLQFLAIDSPMSEHEQSKRATKSAIKGNNFPEVESPRFAASTSKTQEPSVDKKRKRTRCLSDKELFEDGSSDSGSESSQRTIKLDRYNKLLKDARSLDANKKRRFSPPDDQDIEVIALDKAKEQDAHRRKFKKIISISSSDTESESTVGVAITQTPDVKYHSTRQDLDEDLRIQNIIDRWNDEHNAMQRKLIKGSGNTQESVKSRCPTEEKSTGYRLSQRSKALGIETRKNASQKSSAARESDMFESNSMFNSENMDYLLQQPARSTATKTLENDDIINRVLQIDRSRDDADARRPLGYATSQGTKDSGEYLLQDNFDEIIANVELPQSEGMIPCTDQPHGCNLNRPLAEQKTSNCLAMTDETCGAMQETSTIPASSTNDIFEHCGYSARSVKKSSTTKVISRNPDKGKDITANVDEIDKDSRRKITSKQNISHEKEKFFEEHDVSIQSNWLHVDDDKIQRKTAADNESKNDSSEQDTLMNVTLQQAQMQSFEKYLFGASTNRNETKTTRITSQDNPFREELSTPRKRKQDNQDKKSASKEHFAEEDDVVENTPERKMKNRGANVKTTEPRRNIAILSYSSPISISAERTPNTSDSRNKKATPKSDASTPMHRLQIHPLCQSTPKETHNSMVINRLGVCTDNKKMEPVASGSILLPKIDSKGLENANQQTDRRELCFVCSGLMAIQTAVVKEFAMRHNARYVNQFDQNVTHVIVKTTGEENIAKSTLKFLQGIAHRKWIVSYRWIEDCIRQQRLLDEVPYEATTQLDGVNYAGPRDSRLRKKGLFEGFTFLCVGPYVNVSLIQYQDLLLATGAVVVDSLETLAKKEGKKGVVIQENTTIHSDSVIEHWYRTAKAAPIIDDWIVECIGQYKLFKLIPYIISSQDFFAIGYPPEFIEDEEYHDGDDGE